MSRADLALVCLLSVAVGASWWHWALPGGSAASVKVTRAGGAAVRYDLGSPRVLRVDGPLGTSTLEIRDGGIRFRSSPCRQKICLRAGWQRRQGAVAACVPNRIALLLEGPGDVGDVGDALDGMSW